METTLYMVRHGQTNANLDRMIQGQVIDEPLNENGRAQSRALAKHLAETHVDVMYSSPLRRARQTAAAIRELKPDVPYSELPDLMEMRWGVLEGQSFTGTNQAFFDRLNNDWNNGRYDESVDGGESINDVLRRADSAFDTILRESNGKSVLAVAHGRFIRVLLSSRLEEYSLTEMDRVLHPNTAFSKLIIEGGKVRAEYICRTDHLKALTPE